MKTGRLQMVPLNSNVGSFSACAGGLIHVTENSSQALCTVLGNPVVSCFVVDLDVTSLGFFGNPITLLKLDNWN